jgi:hypothetical protein
MLSKSTLVRVALLLPFFVLLAAGIAEVASSPFDWTNTARIDHDVHPNVSNWLASLNTLIAGIPAILIACFAIYGVWRHTAHPFSHSLAAAGF